MYKRQQGLAEKTVANGWSVKRLALEIDYQQMTHDGYWLLPIDARWKFADLVDLEKTFADAGATPDGPRRMKVMKQMGMIQRWCEQICNAGAPDLAEWMLGDMPLADVYWHTKQCAEWERKYAPDVELPAYLRYAWAWSESSEPKERTRAMLATLGDRDDDAFAEALHAGMVEVIREIDADFATIFAEYVSQETPAELVTA